MTDPQGMSSNRPYMLRAMYDWISDNDMSPYLLVNARIPGVRVPAHVVADGQVVLNVAGRAVGALDLGNEWVRFEARFGGVSHRIEVPIGALLAVYAKESGQGMMFPAEEGAATGAGADEASGPEVVGFDQAKEAGPPRKEGKPPSARGAHLRVVK
ncbi:MAG: ClpXP protease specificity-enhancing factor [Lysobacterales bacterium]